VAQAAVVAVASTTRTTVKTARDQAASAVEEKRYADRGVLIAEHLVQSMRERLATAEASLARGRVRLDAANARQERARSLLAALESTRDAHAMYAAASTAAHAEAAFAPLLQLMFDELAQEPPLPPPLPAAASGRGAQHPGGLLVSVPRRAHVVAEQK